MFLIISGPSNFNAAEKEKTRIKEKVGELEESKLKLLNDQGIIKEKLKYPKLVKESKFSKANQLQLCLDERNKEIELLWKEKEQADSRVASLQSEKEKLLEEKNQLGKDFVDIKDLLSEREKGLSEVKEEKNTFK